MASGLIKNPVPQTEILVNDGTQRRATRDPDHGDSPQWESWDGAYGGYISNIDSNAVFSFSQMHIHRHRKFVELNVIMTVKGQMNVGHFYTMFQTSFAPLYTLRTECYGAQSDSDYAVQMGVVSVASGRNVSFTPYEALASGNNKTFRFNILFMIA